jgi:antitoxin PrlF
MGWPFVFVGCPIACEVCTALSVDFVCRLHLSKAEITRVRMLTATITAKGQITIPVEIRNALKLEAGARIAFEEVQPGSYAFKPAAKVPVTALKALFGKHPVKVSIKAMNAAISKRGAAAK